MTAYASGARTDLFERARAKVSIEDLVKLWSIKLSRQGSELRGACPICDGGGSRFAVKGEKWRCYGGDCGFGDVVDLIKRLKRFETEAEAARWLLGEDVAASAPRQRREPTTRDSGPTSSDRTAARIWDDVRPLTGSLAEKYLAKRGISAGVIELASANLRYHPAARHHYDPQQDRWITAPAMVAQVVTAAGPTGGVHVTYLDRETGGKAAIVYPDGKPAPAKKMWGRHHDADGQPGGAWLIGPGGIGALAVAEGIETGLSVVTLAEREGRPLRACAALSLDRMQGRWLRDADNCVDLGDLQPDPRSPAFSWPLPDVGAWNEVLVAVDRDMSELRITARTGRGKPCPMLLDGEARARICGRLAVRAWAATGARKVRAIVPPPRSDFNTELRRVLALESDA